MGDGMGVGSALVVGEGCECGSCCVVLGRAGRFLGWITCVRRWGSVRGLGARGR